MTRSSVGALVGQLGATLSVVLAGSSRPWLAALVGALTLATQVLASDAPGRDARRAVGGALVGLVLESALHGFGLARFPLGTVVPFLCPPWVALFWGSLAVALPRARSLAARPLVTALVGGALSPLAFVSSARAGVLVLGSPLALSIAAIAVLSGSGLYAVLALGRRTQRENIG